jgi:lipopolysaccharide export system permease protein
VLYRARERSTMYLLQPDESDTFASKYPDRIVLEVHERITSPLYTLAFGLITLAFLGRPRTSRQDRSFAVAAVVVICVALRGAGFAALAAGNSTTAVIPMLYILPLAGIAFGAWAMLRNARLRTPLFFQIAWDGAVSLGTRLLGRRQAA